MPYFLIFLIAYLLAGICIFAWAMKGNAIAATRLREFGVDDERMKSFHKQASPLQHLARPTLFFGTIVGGVISLIYWVALA